jgi:hypothetical protein
VIDRTFRFEVYAVFNLGVIGLDDRLSLYLPDKLGGIFTREGTVELPF